MTLLHGFILGIIEGFTEFLPVSSTAHLIVTNYILGFDQSAFIKTFEIAIQSGAILAVVIYYWKRFLDLEILKKIIVAFIPTAIIGLVLYKIVKQYFLGNITLVLWALALGGIVLIISELFFTTQKETQKLDIKSLSYPKAALIGVFQAIAVIPGVSRSAATIIGGRLLGLEKGAIVEFSFLLAVPTILAATGLDLLKNSNLFTIDQIGVLSVGFISSFIFALISIAFLLSFIKNRSFISFGIYRILLVIVFALFFLK